MSLADATCSTALKLMIATIEQHMRHGSTVQAHQDQLQVAL